MHPVTPAVKGWKVLAAVLAVIAWNAADDVRQLAEWLGGRAWLVIAGLVVVVALIGFGYSAIAWRMTRFAVTDEAVHLRSGVVFRQQRQARLDRLQAVDVVQPLLARIIGLSELRLEVAGGAGSAVSLAFLREAEAEQLRAELLARAAGLH
ncbi:PH domain-containing protein, partial [Cellulomonas sp. IC4_254]